MSAGNIFIGTEYTPTTIRSALLTVIEQAAEAGISVNALDGELVIHRVAGTPRPEARIFQEDMPAPRLWGETPPDATLESQPGDAVRCPSHDAPAIIKSNDSACVMALGERGDKWWVLDCNHYAIVRAPR